MQRIAPLVKWVSPFLMLLLIAVALVSRERLMSGLGSGGGKTQHASEAPSRVDKPLRGGDMTYHGGPVTDGSTDVYLISCIDPPFQSPPAKNFPLLKQFVTDLGQGSPQG